MIEVILYHTLIPITSGIFSFVLSFFTTFECISYYKTTQTIPNPNVNLDNQRSRQSNYQLYIPKKNSITFNNEVHFLVIPNISEITPEEKKKIWYSSKEYDQFKHDIINNKY